jgi:hypothetical protein
MSSSSFRPAMLAILVVAALIALATAVMAATSTQRGGSMAVLIDISPSDQANIADRIDSCARGAASKAVHDGAVLTIAPVSSSAVHMAATPILSKLSLTDRLTPDRAHNIQKSAFAKATAQIASVLRSPVRQDSSDTIAATAISGRTLQQQPRPRTLVICGDAHQVSPAFNIYREHLTPARSHTLIELVAPDLADLSDVDVIFGAAGLDAKAAFPNAREEAIARWWKNYWGPAVHARSLWYGSTLPW